MQLRRSIAGFTLVELAIVLTIVAILMVATMATLSAQNEQRDYAETKRRIDAAVEAVMGFAIANRRLPCPATSASTGSESPAGGTCTSYFGGYLPAKTIGLQPTDSDGFAIDAWGNRIRYAVASAVIAPSGATCIGTGTPPNFTSQMGLKANGLTCVPNDLDIICSTAAAVAGTITEKCSSTVRVISQQTVVFLVFSTGKNGATPTDYGPDEVENTNGNSTFVMRTPSDKTAPPAYGQYDDIMMSVPVGVFYSKMIAAGVLP